ncbi:DUF2188 domain-containing protein [Cupriavidus necator]|uniref:DUF2188 domain-containing protein n=1 Tax=Cupriavidus necator TaxID=106590 RepID=UPI00339D7C0A
MVSGIDDTKGNKDVHVVPHEGAWRVEVGGKMEGQDFASQEDAIKACTERAKRDKVELFIHGRDGKIRERNTYGHDPRDIKG